MTTFRRNTHTDCFCLRLLSVGSIFSGVGSEMFLHQSNHDSSLMCSGLIILSRELFIKTDFTTRQVCVALFSVFGIY